MHVIHHVEYLPNMSLRVLIYIGEMDETTGTPLLEMEYMKREISINNPHLESKKNVLISPLIKYVDLFVSN